MRVKIKAKLDKPSFIPFNYQYQLHAAIINIIQKSSPEYADFLHKMGFDYKKEIDNQSVKTLVQKKFKFYTFSYLNFYPYRTTGTGFKNVHYIDFIFSTSVDKNFEHMILGLFADNQFYLQFNPQEKATCKIEHVETLPTPVFGTTENFRCLSPILVRSESEDRKQISLDYLNPDQRLKFISNIKKNLVRKYEAFYKQNFQGINAFDFSFDPEYIAKKNGKISKLITIPKGEHNIKLRGFYAPFTIKTDPKLIEMGYSAGFGVNNAMGLGCVEKI